MSSGLTISAEQRNALYEQIMERLSGIGDVWLAASAQNFDLASRLAREFSDDLRLIVDDLEFGEGTGTSVELVTPPVVLRRVLTRLCASAIDQDKAEAPDRAVVMQLEARNSLVVRTCQAILARIASD